MHTPCLETNKHIIRSRGVASVSFSLCGTYLATIVTRTRNLNAKFLKMGVIDCSLLASLMYSNV